MSKPCHMTVFSVHLCLIARIEAKSRMTVLDTVSETYNVEQLFRH